MTFFGIRIENGQNDVAWFQPKKYEFDHGEDIPAACFFSAVYRSKGFKTYDILDSFSLLIMPVRIWLVNRIANRKDDNGF
jgi:hypothetical protein